MFSATPKRIMPPHVLANAEYVSHTDFDISFLDSLHSNDILSPYFNNSNISLLVIIFTTLIHQICNRKS